MHMVNIHEARTNLSRLIDRAARGEPFIISNGRQAAGQGDAAGRAAGGADETPGLHDWTDRRAG